MPNFTLQNPTDVARAGSTLSWSNIADVLDPTLYADTGPANPGVSADYLAIQIAAPSPPLGSLPATFTFSLRGYVYAAGTVPTWVVDDTVQLYTGGSLVGPNAAQNIRWQTFGTVRNWTISTSGITLSELNAGDVTIYLGFSAPGSDSQFVPEDWDITYTSSGNHNNDGVETAWTSGPGPFATTASSGVGSPASIYAQDSGTITATATYIGGGSAPLYVPVILTETLSASAYFRGHTSIPQPAGDGTLTFDGNLLAQSVPVPYVLNGSFGDSAFTSTQSKTEGDILLVVAGSGSYTDSVSALGNAAQSPATSGIGASSSVNLTVSITSPNPSTLYLDQATLAYVGGAGSGGGSGPGGGVNSGSMFNSKLNVFPPEASVIL